MLPRADIVGTRPVASVEATRPLIPTGDAHQELTQRLNRIALGSFLEGEVLSRLHDGTFTVKVADTTVRMNLPDGAQVGEKLDLTLVGTQPRPTFLLGTAARDNTASLSTAGRLVDSIIQKAQAAGAPATLTGKTPLTPTTETEPGQLAASMKGSLEFSGLFYESHVQQWVNGERPLARLILEPQAKNGNIQQLVSALRAAASNATGKVSTTDPSHLARIIASADATHLARLAANPEPAHLAHLAAKLDAPVETLRFLLNLAHPALPSQPTPSQPQANPVEQTGQGQPQAAITPAPDSQPQSNDIAQTTLVGTAELADLATPASGTTGSQPAVMADAVAKHESLSDESVRTINLQLNTLEQQRVVWQGELWPGQPLEWEIGEDTPHGQQGEAQERAWQSVVRFELPTLGKVAATVRLAGDSLQIQVRTANEAAAALLRVHGDVLSNALAAAGSPLEQLTVKRDDSV